LQPEQRRRKDFCNFDTSCLREHLYLQIYTEWRQKIEAKWLERPKSWLTSVRPDETMNKLKVKKSIQNLIENVFPLFAKQAIF